MKKTVSFLLALVLLLTAVPTMFVAAEEVESEVPEKAFVVDGILDEWYRDDAWAEYNDCYYYYSSIDDTTLDIISREPGTAVGEMDVAYLYEEIQVKIYVAYDDRYAYFYVDVLDSNIATSYTDPNNGSVNAYSQYIENIDFYIDTDYMSCEGDFFDNCGSYQDADTHFRLVAHNLWIGDCKSEQKYIFEGETVNYKKVDGVETDELDYSAVGYFRNSENTVAFHKFDDNGNLIGYGCETRVPLAYAHGESIYQEIYYHIAVTNSRTEDDTAAAIATGKRWWLAYDTGKTVYFEPDEVNPFLGGNEPEEPDVPVEPDVVMGDINGDGKIDAKDALFVLRIAVDKFTPDEKQAQAADVNKDETINAKDALEILKNSVGKPSALDQYQQG